MEITLQDYKRVSVVKASGRIDSSTAPAFEAALKKLVDADKNSLVLDMSDVDYISSAGLRAMVSTLKAVRRGNGDLRLAPPSARVEEVLHLAGLNTLFSTYTSREEAVASF